jgi:hypothetical protein
MVADKTVARAIERGETPWAVITSEVERGHHLYVVQDSIDKIRESRFGVLARRVVGQARYIFCPFGSGDMVASNRAYVPRYLGGIGVP